MYYAMSRSGARTIGAMSPKMRMPATAAPLAPIGLVAAADFTPSLHPRGPDGKFIKGFSIRQHGGWTNISNDAGRGARIRTGDIPAIKTSLAAGGPNVRQHKNGYTQVTDDAGQTQAWIPTADLGTMKYLMYSGQLDGEDELTGTQVEGGATPAAPDAETPTPVTPVTSAAKVKYQGILGAARGRVDGAGTLTDPIDVQGDVDLAAKHLADGKHVRLNTVAEVGTLLDRLHEIATDAQAKGTKAPVYDLCRVSVPGTNLFCAETKGIPRIKMPQFSGEDIVPGSPADLLPRDKNNRVNIEDGFRQRLTDAGVSITPKTVRAEMLKASQNELNGEKVASMVQGLKAGKIKDAPIFVTRDGYIIDGHHRWAAKVGQDTGDGRLGDITMPIEELDMDIGAALDFANEYALEQGLRPQGVASMPGNTDAETLNPTEQRLRDAAQARQQVR